MAEGAILQDIPRLALQRMKREAMFTLVYCFLLYLPILLSNIS